MRLKIQTTKLQEILAKSVRGASNNKLIPLTSLVSIQLVDGCLEFITTDATNYLYIREYDFFDIVDGDIFAVTVAVDTLTKLVSRLTSEVTELIVENNSLTVKANGTYKIDIPLDEDGNIVKFADKLENMQDYSLIGTVEPATISRIITTVKPALLTTMEFPCYTNYYVGADVIGTDTFKISALSKSVLNEPKLISAEVMNLLGICSSNVEVRALDNKMIFNTVDDGILIYAVEPNGIDDYQIDAIRGLTTQKFNSSCKVSKNALVQTLDRIGLFVGAYDKGEISLTFTQNGLVINSKMSTGTETIDYIETENTSEFACSVDITMLSTQIKAQAGDTVTLWYGEPNAIKIVDNDITSVVALLN